MKNNTLASALTPEEYCSMREKLWSLLSWQVTRYTMGESSSVRFELAQELLHSICYSLGISKDHPDERWKRFLQSDCIVEYQKAVKNLEAKTQFGRRLWQTVCTNLPPVENISLLDTLKNLSIFWEKYDCIFFAHEIPCDIDYQLAIPVPDELQGIDFVIAYLKNLLCENQFLSEYSAETIIPILKQYCPDYQELLVNLFEPAINQALGYSILSKPDDHLVITAEDLSRLYITFENMQRTEILKCLFQAVERLKINHARLDANTLDYISRYCQDLAVRIDLLQDRGGLHGIFLCVSI